MRSTEMKDCMRRGRAMWNERDGERERERKSKHNIQKFAMPTNKS
jgi:hypothetical protein